MKKNPEYQYIYQYNPNIGQFCSTFRSKFPISVQEVHISTNQYEWPPCTGLLQMAKSDRGPSGCINQIVFTTKIWLFQIRWNKWL
jgi:hypothetical protein